MKYSNPLTLLCQIISYFKLSVNISVTGKSELCFPFQACINMPNKQAEHASLRCHCLVIIKQLDIGGRGYDSPTWQLELSQAAPTEWVNEWIGVSSQVKNRAPTTSMALFYKQPAQKILDVVIPCVFLCQGCW